MYQVTHQVTMDAAHKDDVVYKNRYDVTILINGLPVVQVELKRPGVEISEAINQINRYRKFSFKGLFRYLQLFVVSNSVQTKYFCNENEMDGGVYSPILKSLVFFWTDANNTRINKLDEFTAEFLRRSTITEMLDKYMVIKTTEPVLMVMRPYQIYAVKAAKRRVLDSNQNGYVFACTGSGKTLTSFKLAQLLREEPRVDKVIFLIDRKDLTTRRWMSTTRSRRIAWTGRIPRLCWWTAEAERPQAHRDDHPEDGERRQVQALRGVDGLIPGQEGRVYHRRVPP
ncbi:MAG: type I restriction endonuclease [Butyricicoccus sp.]